MRNLNLRPPRPKTPKGCRGVREIRNPLSIIARIGIAPSASRDSSAAAAARAGGIISPALEAARACLHSSSRS